MQGCYRHCYPLICFVHELTLSLKVTRGVFQEEAGQMKMKLKIMVVVDLKTLSLMTGNHLLLTGELLFCEYHFKCVLIFDVSSERFLPDVMRSNYFLSSCIFRLDNIKVEEWLAEREVVSNFMLNCTEDLPTNNEILAMIKG